MLQTFSETLARIATLRSLIDFAVVFLLVYVLLRLVRGTRAAPMAAGLFSLLLLYWLSVSQDLPTLEFVLRNAMLYVGVAIIVLFQAEIRQALIYFGNRLQRPIQLQRRAAGQLGETIFDEIVLAAATLSSTKTGALIVVERGVGLRNFVDAGVRLDARLGYDLLITLFNPETPLHDGAVIVQNDRIASAACFLPLTQNPRLSKDTGTRHRAAIGITEDTDAVVVVVSEETGIISFVSEGKIKRNLDTNQLRRLLLEAMQVPIIQRRREPTKTLKESETEITLG